MTQIRSAALVAFGLYGLAVLAWRGLTLPPPRPDAVGHLVAVFREAAPLLPARGTIGYVGPLEPSVSNGEIRFIAQYALVPLVLVDDLAAQRVAISAPGLSGPPHREMLANGWTPTEELASGVRVYRR